MKHLRSPKHYVVFLRSVLVALGILGFALAKTAVAQDLAPEVRDRLKRSAGQVAMGKKVQGEDKIEVIGYGSGWFINDSGLMVTNDHVVNPAHYSKDPLEAIRARIQLGIIQYRVTLHGGTEEEKTFKADLMYQSESGDLALLQVFGDYDTKVKLNTSHYLRLLPSKEIVEGQRVAIVGYPKGQQMATSKDKKAPVTITLGNIDRVERASSGRIKKFKSDAQSAQGNSGGPCVDLDGYVVGVLVELAADAGVTTGASSGVIPADVVGDMVKAALGLNKLQTDLAPFLNLLVGKDLSVFVPGRERLEGKDIIEFADGEESVGKITDSELLWKTSLGEIKIPVELAGYITNDSGTARLLLDGGERLSCTADDVVFMFNDSRGKQSKLKMSNLRSVLFRRRDEQIQYPDLNTLVLRAPGWRLHLADIEGQVAFKDESQGNVSMELRDIRKVVSRYYKQEVYKTDGSKLTGKFEPHTLTAKMVLGDAPVTFSLANATEISTDYVNPSDAYNRKVPLATRLQIDDDELAGIAQLLDRQDAKKAGALLDELLEPSTFKVKAKPVRSQIEALNAVTLLLKGEYEGARQGFKSCRKSKIHGVKTFANGRYEVLKIYPKGEYRGKPLKDPAVFNRAALDISKNTISTAHELMDAYRKAQITKFGDWRSIESKANRMEKDLVIASSLVMGEAERVLFQMWQFRHKRNWDTLKMLLEEREKLNNEFQTRRASNKPAGNIARKINKINSNINVVFLKYGELRDMMDPIGDGPGYRIDDPDAAQFLN